MMADVSIDPGIEACDAIVARIKSGTAYSLPVVVEYTEQSVDRFEQSAQTLVDVVPIESEQLNETLSTEDRTSHQIRVVIRKKVNAIDSPEVTAFKLLVRQIFQRINNYSSSDGRVKVWDADMESKSIPDKKTLTESLLCISSVMLRVEVEAP